MLRLSRAGSTGWVRAGKQGRGNNLSFPWLWGEETEPKGLGETHH